MSKLSRSNIALISSFVGSALTAGYIIHGYNNHYNNTLEDFEKNNMHITVDTSSTADGDIKRDTTYVLTKADFDKLKP